MYATEAGRLIKEKKLSSVELTKEYIDRIKNIDGKVGAYVTLNEEKALQKAAEVQAKIDQGEAFTFSRGTNRSKRYYLYQGCKDNLFF